MTIKETKNWALCSSNNKISIIQYLSKAILLQCCLLIFISVQLIKIDLHTFKNRLKALIHVSNQLILHENGFKMTFVK